MAKKEKSSAERSHKPSSWTQAERDAAKAFRGVKKARLIKDAAGSALSSNKKDAIRKAVKDHYRG